MSPETSPQNAASLLSAQSQRYEHLATTDGAQVALDFALQLVAPAAFPDLFNQIKAAALTDMGAALQRRDLVEQGAERFRALQEDASDAGLRNQSRYNHANATYHLFTMSAGASSWAQAWVADRNSLHDARREYLAVARDQATPVSVRLQAFVNAANSLSSIGRSLEAIGVYDEALMVDADFGMALGNRGLALDRYARYAGPHAPTVLAEACADVAAAVARADSVREHGEPSSLGTFEAWLSKYKGNQDVPLSAPPVLDDPYWGWSQRNGLLLHVSPRCLRGDQRYLDPLYVGAVTTDINNESRIPDVLDSLNVMKADFSAARLSTWLAFESTDQVPELLSLSRRTRYADSRTYARHDLFAGLARQAFSTCNNLLDKVANFLVLYLELEVRHPREVYFRRWWCDKKGVIRPELLPLVEHHQSLLGLCDLAEDFQGGGSRGALQTRRDSATHRFLVPHEYSIPASGRLVDRGTWREFREESIAQLQAARAALIYVVAAVDSVERALRRRGRGPGDLPMTDAEPMPPT